MFYSPPDWLYEAARDGKLAATYALDFWASYAPTLADSGRLTLIDMPSFQAMALAWGTALAAQRSLMDDGILVQAERGGPDVTKKSGAAQVWKDNMAIYGALADRFGLSPKSRYILRAAKDANTPDGDYAGNGILD